MRKFLLFLLCSIVLSFFLVLFKEGDRSFDSESLRLEEKQELVLPQQALLNITFSIPDAKYEVLVPQGSTVYDLMDKASKEYGFSFSGKNFPGIGFFIEEIKGVRQDTRKGLYWVYSINGKKAEVGVSNYILKPHDVITWNYEKGY